MAIGDAISLTLNGVKFAIPKDCEPFVQTNTRSISESQSYGDGTSDGYVSITIPKITGLKVKVSKDNEDAFDAALSNPSMPIVYECIGGSYELTGYIVGDVKYSTTKGLSDEFEVHTKDGGGIRKG